MSYISDTRSEKTISFKGLEKENSYWQEYLNDNDCQYIKGYDWSADSVDNFFNNLDVSYDLEEYIDFDKDYSKEYISLNDEELGNYTEAERVVLIIREQLRSWLEIFRDETIMNLIDRMDDRDYEKIRSEVKSGKRPLRFK